MTHTERLTQLHAYWCRARARYPTESGSLHLALVETVLLREGWLYIDDEGVAQTRPMTKAGIPQGCA
jgi:hypothetical protein